MSLTEKRKILLCTEKVQHAHLVRTTQLFRKSTESTASRSSSAAVWKLDRICLQAQKKQKSSHSAAQHTAAAEPCPAMKPEENGTEKHCRKTWKSGAFM